VNTLISSTTSTLDGVDGIVVDGIVDGIADGIADEIDRIGGMGDPTQSRASLLGVFSSVYLLTTYVSR
jgi:hypothetical protein